jgi:paired amphipathic helix protein Sin3a
MEYVQRIKTRFSNDPDTYKQFLEILSNYKSSANNVRSTASSSQLY